MKNMCLAVLPFLMISAGCRPKPPPLTVERDRISVVNDTRDSWQKIEVRLNGYYVAQLDALAAGGRLDAPLDRFQGGFGRFFNPSKDRVRDVVVTATTRDGKPVKLTWPPG
jgi:hypothetical protein